MGLNVPGMSEAQVRLVLDHLRKPLSNSPVLSSYTVLIDYLHGTTAHSTRERLTGLFLDRKNRLITDEVLAHGTVDHVPVYPREIVRRCIELDASALILSHNHPSGDPTPSDSDLSMTREIQAALSTIGVTLHDHIIIGHSSEYSFRAHDHLI